MEVPSTALAESYDLPKEQIEKLFLRRSFAIFIELYGVLLLIHFAMAGSLTFPDSGGNWPLDATWMIVGTIEAIRCGMIAQREKSNTAFRRQDRLVMVVSVFAALLGASWLWLMLT